MKKTIRVGSVELTEEEAKKLYLSGRVFIASYRKIYKLQYNARRGCFSYGLAYTAAKAALPFTRRGRFYAALLEEAQYMTDNMIINK